MTVVSWLGSAARRICWFCGGWYPGASAPMWACWDCGAVGAGPVCAAMGAGGAAGASLTWSLSILNPQQHRLRSHTLCLQPEHSVGAGRAPHEEHDCMPVLGNGSDWLPICMLLLRTTQDVLSCFANSAHQRVGTAQAGTTGYLGRFGGSPVAWDWPVLPLQQQQRSVEPLGPLSTSRGMKQHHDLHCQPGSHTQPPGAHRPLPLQPHARDRNQPASL